MVLLGLEQAAMQAISLGNCKKKSLNVNKPQLKARWSTNRWQVPGFTLISILLAEISKYWKQSLIGQTYWLLFCLTGSQNNISKCSTDSVLCVCVCSRQGKEQGICECISNSSIYSWQCIWLQWLSDRFPEPHLLLVWKLSSMIIESISLPALWGVEPSLPSQPVHLLNG